MDKFVAKYCFEYMSNKRLSVTHTKLPTHSRGARGKGKQIIKQGKYLAKVTQAKLWHLLVPFQLLFSFLCQVRTNRTREKNIYQKYLQVSCDYIDTTCGAYPKQSPQTLSHKLAP